MLATGLKHIWEARVSKKQITPFQVRAELEAKIYLLRGLDNRYVGAGSKMQELLETYLTFTRTNDNKKIIRL